MPALGRTVRGAGPVVEALNPFLDELNPVLSLLGFYQTRIAGFLTNGGAALQGDFGGERYAPNTVLFESRSFERYTERPEHDRGHVYLPPNEFNRIQPLGGYDSPDCSRAIGPRNRYGDVPQNDALSAPAAGEGAGAPPGLLHLRPQPLRRHLLPAPAARQGAGAEAARPAGRLPAGHAGPPAGPEVEAVAPWGRISIGWSLNGVVTPISPQPITGDAWALAASQHDVITHEQLRALGYTEEAIRHRLAHGPTVRALAWRVRRRAADRDPARVVEGRDAGVRCRGLRSTGSPVWRCGM